MTEEPYTGAVEFCVQCGRTIPETEWREPSNRAVVKHLYCSVRCARRQQETLKRLRETTPQAMTYLPELLVLLHAAAVELEASHNLLEHHWGVHLLDDWKSLMLLAEKTADELESAPVAAP